MSKFLLGLAILIGVIIAYILIVDILNVIMNAVIKTEIYQKWNNDRIKDVVEFIGMVAALIIFTAVFLGFEIFTRDIFIWNT